MQLSIGLKALGFKAKVKISCLSVKARKLLMNLLCCAVKIPLLEVEKEWRKESAGKHIEAIAEHYGIYEDLFNGDYFTPVTNLHICYDYDDDLVTPVYYGNRIFPAEVSLREFIFISFLNKTDAIVDLEVAVCCLGHTRK